jgi:phage gp45-like
MDSFGGGNADTFRARYRPDKSVLNQKSQKDYGPGRGSKVLLLCINGENHNAVIIGGISDQASPDDSEENGHCLHFNFNGVDVNINNDGELLIEYQGATKNDGELRDDVDEKAVGTSIHIKKNGNVEIADSVQDGDNVVAKNFIVLDHENSKLDITAAQTVNVTAPRVNLGGSDASSPVPLGDKLTDLLGELIDAITQLTVISPTGATSPPVNTPQFQTIKAKLQSTLSEIVYDK